MNNSLTSTESAVHDSPQQSRHSFRSSSFSLQFLSRVLQLETRQLPQIETFVQSECSSLGRLRGGVAGKSLRPDRLTAGSRVVVSLEHALAQSGKQKRYGYGKRGSP